LKKKAEGDEERKRVEKTAEAVVSVNADQKTSTQQSVRAQSYFHQV
jgi:hypothetical protein